MGVHLVSNLLCGHHWRGPSKRGDIIGIDDVYVFYDSSSESKEKRVRAMITSIYYEYTCKLETNKEHEDLSEEERHAEAIC